MTTLIGDIVRSKEKYDDYESTTATPRARGPTEAEADRRKQRRI